MNLGKEEYERRIKISPIFELDNQSYAYRVERFKLIEDLYNYLMALNKKDYEPYACEIMDVASRCIRGYRGEKGEFLHYFNVAWKREYAHIYRDEVIEGNFQGLKVSEADRRVLAKVGKYLQNKTINRLLSEDQVSIIANDIGISKDELISALKMSKIHVISGTVSSSSGEKFDIVEMIMDHNDLTDDQVIDLSNIDESLSVLDHLFSGLQYRQKRIISTVLTVRVCPLLIEYGIEWDKYDFVDKDVICRYLEKGELPTQRTIANDFNRDESSISRTVREFLKKLKDQLKT